MRNGLIIGSNPEALGGYREIAQMALPMINFHLAYNIDEAIYKTQKYAFQVIIYINKHLDCVFFEEIKKLHNCDHDPILITINNGESKSTLSKLFSSGVKGCILANESNEEMVRLLSVIKYGIVPISPKVVDILTEKNTVTDDAAQLTNRENDVFNLLCKGLTNKYIAKSLNLSVYTVADHVKSIFKKMNVHSRTALISQQLNIN